MSKKDSIKKLVGMTVSAGFAIGLSGQTLASHHNTFKSESIQQQGSFKVAGHMADGKCGSGKCGGEKKSSDGKCGSGKCGGEKKSSDGKCGSGKCGGEKKSSDGKCGSGKCGGNH